MANNFDRKESYPIETILSQVPKLSELGLKQRKKYKIDFDGDMIKMCSDRYYTFIKSTDCSFCGVKGSFFRKERHCDKDGNPLTESYHFNLYAIKENGEEVLMTKDHIIPRSRGGRNNIKNYQTACEECNGEKGSTSDHKFKEQMVVA